MDTSNCPEGLKTINFRDKVLARLANFEFSTLVVGLFSSETNSRNHRDLQAIGTHTHTHTCSTCAVFSPLQRYISKDRYEFLTMERLYSGYFIVYGWVPRCATADLHNSGRYRSTRLTRAPIRNRDSSVIYAHGRIPPFRNHPGNFLALPVRRSYETASHEIIFSRPRAP